MRLGLGRAQIARRDADAALAELQKAVELDPKNAEAQYQLGYVQQVHEAERRPSAVGPYEKAVGGGARATRCSATASAARSGPRSSRPAVEELTKATATPGYRRPAGLVLLGAAQLKASRYKEARAGAREVD